MNIEQQQYREWLETLKNKIQVARLKIAVSINAQLMEVYWELGSEIVQKQQDAEWGDSVLDQLATDLRLSFPNVKGFSRRNMYAIRQWYLFYREISEFVPQPVAQIPWGHNRLIISKLKDPQEALFYANATVENGWTRYLLEDNIRKGYRKSVGKSTNNFARTLPTVQSQLAIETIRNPYNFDFLGLEDEAIERDIENAMVTHITRFLVELGKGFAFVGRQYQLVVSESEYYIDLLFYHLELRSYVVIELKAGKFKPEYVGKLNFYLSAIDSQIKHASDNPSIGLILCKTKDKIAAEYSLRDVHKPIGISEFNLTKALPENLKSQLPTVDQLEDQLAQIQKDA